MLCPRFHSPLADPMWPLARSLWPETRPLFYSVEQDVLRHLQEMRHNMEYMEKLHQRIFEQIDQALPSGSAFRPVAVENLGGDNGTFALSLDTSDFCPEELSVKQVGHKLRVSGKTEKKQDDGKGSYSYRCQEFRQEFDLPGGIVPETVSCSLVGGRLQITAPQNTALESGKERLVPITVAAKPAIHGKDEAKPDESEKH
ncbi:heat shock protein beta 9-like [Eucyclogobius newberryi]|uniref:heat shock protein beta 9-like n=1 Tax=Eucyclogobius newberryi TaxID=166745 RepID=UPI003B58C1BD